MVRFNFQRDSNWAATDELTSSVAFNRLPDGYKISVLLFELRDSRRWGIDTIRILHPHSGQRARPDDCRAALLCIVRIMPTAKLHHRRFFVMFGKGRFFRYSFSGYCSALSCSAFSTMTDLGLGEDPHVGESDAFMLVIAHLW
jgi:hypothetical protein